MKKILIIGLILIVIVSGYTTCATTHQTQKTIQQHQNSETYDLFIIAPEQFTDQLQPLITHKNNHNVKTILKTTETIYTEYTGRDPAEQIKYAIKDTIETSNTKYVLLVGGMKPLTHTWYVPVRYSNLDDGFGHQTFLTDLYFADIYKNNGTEFEDWDSNGNNIFAEWGTTGDTLDLTPDVALGRLPCRTKKEVTTIVEKIITYETTTYGKSWFTHMVAVGSDTFPDYTGYEGESTCDIATSYMTNFTIEKLYTSTGSLTDPDDVVTALNQGCGFFLTRGRGGTDRIRMVMPEGSEFIAFNNNHISKLDNQDMYPICVLGECIHARFDVGLINILKLLQKQPGYNLYDCIFECIAWRFLREKNAGAIAVLTNTNICFGAYGDSNYNGILDDAELFGGYLAVELFRLYGIEEIDTLGTLYQQAVSNYIDFFPVDTNKIDCKSVQEFILFGDPSLQIGGYPTGT